MKFSDYKNLIVWQKSIDLVIDIYEILKLFPKEERYALSDQIKRCVTSIPSNIAEGHGRNTINEYVRFLSYSRGSATELETQIIISQRLGYITNEKCEDLNYKVNSIIAMISALMNKLENSKS